MDIEKFHDELIDLWNNYYNTEYVYDIIFVDDDYIEVKCENKKIANEFADFIMAYYKAPICYDFRKENGCYQFSISPSLMIRESKKSARKSIKENRLDKDAVVYEFTCLLNRLGFKGVDYSNEENNEKCDDIVYMIMDLLKTMPRL